MKVPRHEFTLIVLGDSGLLAVVDSSAYDLFMATVQEIERAIERLPETERNALESRLLARRCGLSSLNDEEQAELLSSLDDAEREIDEGRSHNTDEMRQALRGWLGK